MKLLMSHMTAAAMRLFQEHTAPVPATDPYEEKREPFRRIFEFPLRVTKAERVAAMPVLHSVHPDYPDRVAVWSDDWIEFSALGACREAHVLYAELREHVMLSDMSIARRIEGRDELYRGKPL